jgi:hypothetical protein
MSDDIARIAAREIALEATMQAGECDLCAGKCRGHSLGRPEQWEPEVGSRAAMQPGEGEVERGARALSSALQPKEPNSMGQFAYVPWEWHKDYCTMLARAAIAAMKGDG